MNVSNPADLTTRNVLIAANWRNVADLSTMSDRSCRSALVTELRARTNKADFRQYNDEELIGKAIVLMFLREAGIRTDADLKAMSDDDQRKALIVENQQRLGIPSAELQQMSDQRLVELGLAWRWRVRGEPLVKSEFAPLRLIGERRQSTPRPDDQKFLTATTLREEFSDAFFNGLKNRVLRDVEISGPLLRWSGSNMILQEYYGEAASDIRSLVIYADRMEVADRLHFPRANVAIHARELVFTGIGCIDTTPLPYVGKARSVYVTTDPFDPTNANAPADADGKPTYCAADGANGEPGGSVTLHVRTLIDGDGTRKRFICRGGKGQEGEPGGLKAYVQKEGYLEKYGPSKALSADEISSFVSTTRKFPDVGSEYRWPGETGGPGEMTQPAGNPAGAIVKAGRAVAVKLLIYSDVPLNSWIERGCLPSADLQRWGGTYTFANVSEFEGAANPFKLPCDGRDAYPGGWPGDGGGGGDVTSVLASAPIAAAVCDLNPGAPGDDTPEMAGSPAPGPRPAYAMTIKLVKRTPPFQSSRQPEISLTEVTGKPGASAPVRQWTKGQSRARKGGRHGKPVNRDRHGLSWAHPASVAAVIHYARTAYRNGFRDEAAQALEPYCALLSENSSAVAAADSNLRLALASIAAMRNNLIQNVDYYGNPPGWVPRLNALSNLAVLKSVREVAYGTYYFAHKMLDDYASLENARELSKATSAALADEITEARASLRAAYEKMPLALKKLDKVQQEVFAIEQDILLIRNTAITQSKDRVQVQCVVSAALQIAGGIAKSLPVGQPFVGLAGSALGAISEFDWNAEQPLASARSALDSLTGHVNTFVADKPDSIVAAVTSGLNVSAARKEDLVTKLTEQLEAEEKMPAEKQESAERKWTEFKTEERSRLEAQIQAAKSAASEIREHAKQSSDPDAGRPAEAADSLAAQLQRQKLALEEKRVGGIRKQLVEYRKQQAELEAQARVAATAENAKLKQTAAQVIATKAPPSLKERLTLATADLEVHKGLIAEREATSRQVLSSLENVGSGLSMIGSAVISLATPLTEDDPTVKRLTEQMLVDDPELRDKGRELNSKLMAILERKKQATTELLYWQHKASASLATVTGNLVTMTELSRQRQSFNQGLDPSVQSYLKDTRERAKDTLAESIYWFVKSYQYEFLSDVPDSFYKFDSWAEELRKLEAQKQPATAVPEVGPSETRPVAITKGRPVLLAKEDFDRIGDAVFKAEQLKLGDTLLRTRQKRGENFEGTYNNCVLERRSNPANPKEIWANQMLDRLAETGEITFNFINDFGKGSFLWNNARVVKAELTVFDAEADDRNLSLTIRIEHTGESIIGCNVPIDRRVFYVFRPGRDVDPVSWEFVYNHKDKQTNSGLTKSGAGSAVEDSVKSLISADLPPLREYQPSLFSDYKIRITDLSDGNGHKKSLRRIKQLEMNVTLSNRS